MDDNRKKRGPPRKLSYLDEFLLVLMRLKAGLFVQDLADSFGISTSLVSRMCITWINLLYVELKDLFPFPARTGLQEYATIVCSICNNKNYFRLYTTVYSASFGNACTV